MFKIEKKLGRSARNHVEKKSVGKLEGGGKGEGANLKFKPSIAIQGRSKFFIFSKMLACSISRKVKQSMC